MFSLDSAVTTTSTRTTARRVLTTDRLDLGQGMRTAIVWRRELVEPHDLRAPAGEHS